MLQALHTRSLVAFARVMKYVPAEQYEDTADKHAVLRVVMAVGDDLYLFELGSHGEQPTSAVELPAVL
jgi:hypothetical protein